MTDRRFAILMLVSGDPGINPRVNKEAMSAYRAGHHVAVICRESTRSQPFDVFPTLVQKPAKRTAVRLSLRRLLFFQRVLATRIGFRPDIIHANDLDMLFPGWLLAKRFRAALVYDSHEAWTHFERGLPRSLVKILRRAEGSLARRADAVVTVSDALADFLADEWSIPKPIVVLNALPATALDPDRADRIRRDGRSRLGLEPDDFLLVFNGHFRAHFGLHRVLEELALMPTPVHLLLRGYGDEEANLRLLATRLDLDRRVHWAGQYQPDDVISGALVADVGLVPLVPAGPQEVFASPNKLFEYLTAGLPVIAADLPGLTRLIGDHNIGRVYDPTTAGSLARVVQSVMNTPNLMATLQASVADARDVLTWEAQYIELTRAYHLAVSRRRTD